MRAVKELLNWVALLPIFGACVYLICILKKYKTGCFKQKKMRFAKVFIHSDSNVEITWFGSKNQALRRLGESRLVGEK